MTFFILKLDDNFFSFVPSVWRRKIIVIWRFIHMKWEYLFICTPCIILSYCRYLWNSIFSHSKHIPLSSISYSKSLQYIIFKKAYHLSSSKLLRYQIIIFYSALIPTHADVSVTLLAFHSLTRRKNAYYVLEVCFWIFLMQLKYELIYKKTIPKDNLFLFIFRV